MAEDLRYEMSIDNQQFLEGSRKSTKALTDIDKHAKMTDKGLNDLYNSGVRLGGGMTKTAQGVNTATKSFKAMSGATSQLSFQLQDIAVQAQMGTDAFIILGQQGPQIASIFGAGGAVVGALIAFGSLLAGAFVNGANSAKESIEDMISSVESLSSAERDYLAIRIQGKLDDLSTDIFKAERSVTVLSKSIDRQQVVLDRFNAGEASDWLTELTSSSDSARASIGESNKELAKAAANVGRLLREQERYASILSDLNNGVAEQSKGVKVASEAFVDLSRSMAVQIELAGKSEREQAKIAAAHQLGTERTAEQVTAINTLIDAYFNEMDALKQKKDADDAAKKEAKKNEQLLTSLSNAYEVAKLKSAGYAKEAFILSQTQKLGASATKEQVEELKKLSALLFEASETQKAMGKRESADPLKEMKKRFEAELELLVAQTDAKLIEAERFETLKRDLEVRYEEERMARLEAEFVRQSSFNALLIDSINGYGNAATGVITGVINGTMTASQAFKSLGNTILNSVVGALVEEGVMMVKNSLLHKATTAANLATSETAKAASTASGVAQGATLTAAYAPAAASASIASFGGAAAAGSAALLAAVPLMIAAFGSSGKKGGSPSQPSIPSQPSTPTEAAKDDIKITVNFTGNTDDSLDAALIKSLNNSIANGAQIVRE